MAQGSDWFFWMVLIALFVGFVYLPQWMNRRRRRAQESALEVGDQVLTIGGLMGTLVYINMEENVARVCIAEGVVVDMLPGAISGKRDLQTPESCTDTEE